MKTYNNLWDEFISRENFELACKNSQKRKKRQYQVREFNENYEENLSALIELVASGNFHTSKYKEMTIYEPKERIIYKLPYYPDRIVQHAVMNILKPILSNLFIENSYACIENRGQLKASQKCSEYTRKYKYCLKCDISKFYPSINQTILSEMLHRIIKDERFMEVVYDIIFSFEGGYNCPIGNYCSQWFGNFYLTKLDNHVLHDLKCGAYVRYCDDFLLFSNDKQYLNYCKENNEQFLRDELELKYSKADVFSTKQGVDFCGYRSFGKYVLVRKSTGKRMKKLTRDIREQIDSGEYDAPHVEGQLASVNGILCHGCCHHFSESIKLDEYTKKAKEYKDCD